MSKIIEHFIDANVLGETTRRIIVRVPSTYQEESTKIYPVLYMHDGQNMVDESPLSGYSWDIARTLDALEGSNQIEALIVVGIDAHPTKRIHEYTSTISERAVKRVRKGMKDSTFQPKGDSYMQFLVEVVMPFIKNHYRIRTERTHTGTFGSSCGGNISWSLLVKYPDVFGVVGAFSPAYWFISEWVFDDLKKMDIIEPLKIYHDMGTKEQTIGNCFTLMQVRKIQSILEDKGLDAASLKLMIDRKATHTELFWQIRFREFVLWAFGINTT